MEKALEWGEKRDKEREKAVNKKLDAIKKEIFPLFDTRIVNYKSWYGYHPFSARGVISVTTVSAEDKPETIKIISEFQQSLESIDGVDEAQIDLIGCSALGASGPGADCHFNIYFNVILDEE